MLEITNVSKKYGDRTILDNVSLKFESNGLYFIVGDSGAGKSTLLNILGLLDTDFSGEIKLDGKTVQYHNEDIVSEYHKKAIGFIFQDYNLINYMTVEENIIIAGELFGVAVDDKKVNTLIDELKLSNVKNNFANQLSGGEKQRTSIARILCRNNSIILADEPTGNVDKKNSNIIFDTLKNIAKEKLVIVITHNESAAEKYGDHIIKVEDGVIECFENNYDEANNIQESHNTSNILSSFSENKTKSNPLKLTLQYLFRNKKRLISSFIITTFCMLIIGAFICSYYAINNLTDVLNESVMENDKLTITKESNNMFMLGRHMLDDDIYNEILNDENVKYGIKYYSDFLNITTNNKNLSIQYNIVDSSQFFKNRYDDLEGNIPSKYNEVIISSDIAKIIYDTEDCIGEHIIFNFVNKNYDCIITGIRKNKEKLNKDIYITKELSDILATSLVDKTDLYCNISDVNNDNYYPALINTTNRSNVGEYDLIYGNDISSESEVLLDVSYVNDFLQKIGMSLEYSESEIIKGKLDEIYLSNIFSSTLHTYANVDSGTIYNDIKIVGICSIKNVDKKSGIITTDEYVERFKTPIINTFDIYVKSSKEKDLKSLNKILEANECRYDSPSKALGIVMFSKLSIITGIFLVAMVFILIVTVIMIHFLSKAMLMDRLYEIGVLKSLGATKQFILQSIILQNTIIGAACGSISTFIVSIIVETKIIKISGVPVFYGNYLIYITIIVLGIIVSVLSSFINAYKISRKSVIDCIVDKR